MVIYDLECALGHLFEGWFASAEEYEEQRAGGLIECPVCGDRTVEKRPPAPAFVKARDSQSAPPPPDLVRQAVREVLFEVAAFVRANTEDVGSDFARQALSMHRGESEVRPIRGTATEEEERELAREGVPYVKLPLPEPDA